MLTGEELGAAIASAIEKKKVKKKVPTLAEPTNKAATPTTQPTTTAPEAVFLCPPHLGAQGLQKNKAKPIDSY